MIDDLPARYREYLDRFMTEIGDKTAGAYVKFSGKLIQKLSFEEFTPVYLDYQEVLKRYTESIERGDTINDVVLRLLREKSASLVLPNPAD